MKDRSYQPDFAVPDIELDLYSARLTVRDFQENFAHVYLGDPKMCGWMGKVNKDDMGKIIEALQQAYNIMVKMIDEAKKREVAK